MPTAASFTEVSRYQVYFEDFSGATAHMDNLIGPWWPLHIEGSERALEVNQADLITRISPFFFTNYAAQLRFKVLQGSFQLTFRAGGVGRYTFAISPQGELSVVSQHQVFQVALASFTPNGWNTLYIESVAGEVHVSVNGLEAVSIVDPAYAAPGALAFFVSGGTPEVILDDIILWNVVLSSDLSTASSSDTLITAQNLTDLYSNLLSVPGDVFTYGPDFGAGYQYLQSGNRIGPNILSGQLPALPLDVRNAWSPSWSANGQRLVFRCQMPDYYSLCIVNANGTGFQALEFLYYLAPSQPVLSPNGDRIAFSGYDESTQTYNTYQYLVDAVYPTLVEANAGYPRLVGDYLYYILGYASSSPTLMRRHINGGNHLAITNAVGSLLRQYDVIELNPNVHRVIYRNTQNTSPFNDRIVQVDVPTPGISTGLEHTLLTRENFIIYSPQLSPRGDRVAYITSYFDVTRTRFCVETLQTVPAGSQPVTQPPMRITCDTPDSGDPFDWAGNVNLTPGNPVSTPTPIVVPTQPVPTPNPTPAPQTYHVNFINYGSSTWGQEQSNANEGIVRVGQALFSLLSAQFPTRQATSYEEAFNRIIVYSLQSEVLLIRSNEPNGTVMNINYNQVQLQYTIDFYGVCKAFAGNVAASTPQAIICNGNNFIVTEYTIAHEIGHLLDYRATDYLSNSVQFATGSQPLSLGSCVTSEFSATYTIMGFNTAWREWRRGPRGWGTGGSGVTDFQQNPSNEPIEAAADMFLNWAYRLTSPGSTLAVDQIDLTNSAAPGLGCIPLQNQQFPPTVPQPWEGFQNRNWDNLPQAPFDWGLPGDIRFRFMDDVLINLLTVNPTW
jgi:hypothetical protein